MALDVYFIEDIENIIASVELMGGDLFTLNAIRRAFGLPMVEAPDTQQVRYVTSTAREIEPAQEMKVFDPVDFSRRRDEIKRQQRLG